jgi:hypothetical protein
MSKLGWMSVSALCLIGFSTGCSEQHMAQMGQGPDPVAGGELTYYKDVLPIARRSCQGCHTPDGIAPFSLLSTSYAEAKDHAQKIAQNVQDRIMPPWMPDPSCGSFVDDRRLPDADIKTLVDWVAGGAIEGDPATTPPGGDAVAQHLDTVSATLEPAGVYTPIGDPNDPSKLDDYHCMIIDPKLAADQDVIATEVIPGVVREVHHVIMYTAPAADAKAKDDSTPEPGWTCFGGPGIGGNFSNLGMLGGWVPGMPPTKYPATTGIHLKQGDVIVMQVHYNLLNGPPLPDHTAIKLQYSPAPVDKRAVFFPAYDFGFSIPPHAEGYVSTASQNVPINVQAWGIIPHMHTLGRQISVKTPSTCLVDVSKWDFHWQQGYFYTQPISLAQGETATISCNWSNPTDNTVTFGEGTTDEMCLAFLYVTF